MAVAEKKQFDVLLAESEAEVFECTDGYAAILLSAFSARVLFDQLVERLELGRREGAPL